MKTSLPLTSHSHHSEAATPTAALRHEHEVILRALALLERLGQGLQAGQAVEPAILGRLREFFSAFADRCHHGKEEQHLFPAMERHGIPREGGPIGVMLAEHEEGRACIRAMAETEIGKAADAIRRYVNLLRAHIDKENDILFPMAEGVIPGAEQQGLLRAFDAVEQTIMGPGAHERLLAELAELEQGLGVLDVRTMPPRERHPKIFEIFERLEPGATFILVNDHDPKPLYYQFAAERPGKFTWQYLEQGPEVWRVEIGKAPA